MFVFAVNFTAHVTPGVVAMSWCPSDSSYLLTCAKDNRTICWDMVSAEVDGLFCWSMLSLLKNYYLNLFCSLCVYADLLYAMSWHWFWCLFLADRLWIASWNQLEFWCPLVSKDTRGHISIFIWWENWHLQYWGLCYCTLIVLLQRTPDCWLSMVTWGRILVTESSGGGQSFFVHCE